MIEDVERFAQNFSRVPLAKTDALGKSHVHINCALRLKRITADDINAFTAVGTVDPTAQGLDGYRGDVAGDRIR